MNLTRQDLKERKKYERQRDVRWLQIEECKLERKISELKAEHNTKIRSLTLEHNRFVQRATRKGFNSPTRSPHRIPNHFHQRRSNSSDSSINTKRNDSTGEGDSRSSSGHASPLEGERILNVTVKVTSQEEPVKGKQPITRERSNTFGGPVRYKPNLPEVRE